MKILDIDLKKAMMDMPDPNSVQLIHAYASDFHHKRISKNLNSYRPVDDYDWQYFTHDLIYGVNEARKSYGLEEDNSLFKDNHIIGFDLRHISPTDFNHLTNKVMFMKKGLEYAKQFEKMSSKEIYNCIIEHQKKFNCDSTRCDTLSKELEPQEKLCTLEYLFIEKKLSELLQNVSLNKLQTMKNQFEEFRDNDYDKKPDRYLRQRCKTYLSTVFGVDRMSEYEILFSDEFGDKNKEFSIYNFFNVVDIGEALENREKELNEQQKKLQNELNDSPQKIEKVGFFARIKNFFSRKNNQKLLTDGNIENNENNDWLKSIKYTDQKNIKTSNVNQHEQIQKDHNSPER